jgi:DNA-binding MarR family transcriptional regulator
MQYAIVTDMEITATKVCDDMLVLMNNLKRGILALAEARGMTNVQVFALYSIDQHGNVPMGHMAEVLHCDASNVTGIVDRLVSQGLVVRQESMQDRRAKKLNLTPKGQSMINDIKDSLPTHFGCNKLSSEERTTLHAIVQKMCA